MQLDWITEKSFGKYAKNAAQEELNSFYGIAKSMRDSGMDHEVIAENLKTMYGATPEQVEMIQNEVLGKTADVLEIVNHPLFSNPEIGQKVNELMEMQNYIETQIDALRVLFLGHTPEHSKELSEFFGDTSNEDAISQSWEIIRKPFIFSGVSKIKEGWGTILDF